MALSIESTVTNQISLQRTGYLQVSFTNFYNDSEPELNEGSLLEIGNSLLKAEADESISGWSGISNETNVYIYVDSSTYTLSFSDTAPAWSSILQGWYNSTNRCIAGLYKDGSGNYTNKWIVGKNEYENQIILGSTGKQPSISVASAGWSNVNMFPDFNNIIGSSIDNSSGTYRITLPAGRYTVRNIFFSEALRYVQVYNFDSSTDIMTTGEDSASLNLYMNAETVFLLSTSTEIGIRVYNPALSVLYPSVASIGTFTNPVTHSFEIKKIG